MPKFEVVIEAEVTDTHVFTLEVEADTEEAAREQGIQDVLDHNAGEPRTQDGPYQRDNTSAVAVYHVRDDQDGDDESEIEENDDEDDEDQQ